MYQLQATFNIAANTLRSANSSVGVDYRYEALNAARNLQPGEHTSVSTFALEHAIGANLRANMRGNHSWLPSGLLFIAE